MLRTDPGAMSSASPSSLKLGEVAPVRAALRPLPDKTSRASLKSDDVGTDAAMDDCIAERGPLKLALRAESGRSSLLDIARADGAPVC